MEGLSSSPLSFSTPPDSPLSPLSPRKEFWVLQELEEEIDDTDPIEQTFPKKPLTRANDQEREEDGEDEEEIEQEIDSDSPPHLSKRRNHNPNPVQKRPQRSVHCRLSTPTTSQQSRQTLTTTRYQNSVGTKTQTTPRPRQTSSQRRVHQPASDERRRRYSLEGDEDFIFSSSLSSSCSSPSSLSSSCSSLSSSFASLSPSSQIQEERKEKGTRERDRHSCKQRHRGPDNRDRGSQKHRERDILPSSPSSQEAVEPSQQPSKPKRNPSLEEEIDDFSDGEIMANTTPTTIPLPLPSLRGEEFLPDEDIGSFSPPPSPSNEMRRGKGREGGDFFRPPHANENPHLNWSTLSPQQLQSSHQPFPDPLPSPQHQSPQHHKDPTSSSRLQRGRTSHQQQRSQEDEEDIEMEEEENNSFQSPKSLSPFSSRTVPSSHPHLQQFGRKGELGVGAEVERDVREEDGDGLSSIDELDLMDLPSRSAGFTGLSFTMKEGEDTEKEKEEQSEDDEVIDIPFDFGPSGQNSFISPFPTGESGEEKEEAIESMSDGEGNWDKRREEKKKEKREPPPSDSLDEESGLGTILLNDTMLLKKGSPYSTPKNTQRWGKSNTSLGNRKRQRINENALENLMTSAVRRHTQLMRSIEDILNHIIFRNTILMHYDRELAHTEGGDGGRRRGSTSTGLKIEKLGIVVKEVIGEEKCGDGRGGEGNCLVVEARPYISKKEEKGKMILFVKKKGGGASLFPGHLCQITSWYECHRPEKIKNKGEGKCPVVAEGCRFLFCEDYRVTGAIVSQKEMEEKRKEETPERFVQTLLCKRETPLAWLKTEQVDQNFNSFLSCSLFSVVQACCSICCVYPHPCLDPKNQDKLRTESCFSHFSQFQSMILVKDSFGWFGLIAIPLSNSQSWWDCLFNPKRKNIVLPPLKIERQTFISKDNHMHSVLQLYQQKSTQQSQYQKPQHQHQRQQEFLLGHAHSIPLTLLVPAAHTTNNDEKEKTQEDEAIEEAEVVQELVLGSVHEILDGVREGHEMEGKREGGGVWRVSLSGIVDSFFWGDEECEVGFVYSGWLNIVCSDDIKSITTIKIKKSRCFHDLPQFSTRGTPILIRHAAISRQERGEGAGGEVGEGPRFSALVFIDEFSVIEQRG